jgi:hypothetical protein
MGGSPWGAICRHLPIMLSPAFAGFELLCFYDLGLTPQALCLRLLRRLKRHFGAKHI